MKIQSIKSSKKAFSLVELLVVIAVIGIIAAIALPAMTGIFDRSRVSKNRRNAQALSAALNGAKGAGVDVSSITFGSTSADAAKAVAAHFTTPRNGTGVNSSAYFSVSMTPAEAEACAAYLTFHAASGQLVYNAGGDGVATTN